MWLVLLVVVLPSVMLAVLHDPLAPLVDRIDSAILVEIAEVRTPWLTRAMSGVARVGVGWTVTAMAVTTLALLIGFRRWRHMCTYIGSVALLEYVTGGLYEAASRPRPYGVTTIGRWGGFSLPSPPVALLAATLVAVIYTLIVPGRARNTAKWVVAGLLAVFVVARLYLGVDHPTDVVIGLILGVGIPVLGFRLFTPNEVFPVTYRGGKTAHLDVGGRRGEAIRQAVSDQLGLTILDAKPVGLAGSGGSTPLRLTVAGTPNVHLFAKLYALNHVRADRWYKLGRTILYGRLEDEAPFQTVRRLVEYEDYTLRLLQDLGIPTATPYGIVEITPSREYLLVTELFEGAREIGEADVDDGVIENGLLLIRRLWDAGLAHRDITPANLLFGDGLVLLIDLFFVQVRPSPWRQAVDLANMMLVLAVRTDTERVYQRALKFFTPDEIAEAFAATRGVASPTQLRAAMKRDGRNLIGEFRALAPERPRIAIQRWSVRRVVLAVGVVIGVVLAVTQTVRMLSPAGNLTLSASPDCGSNDVLVLLAQSVPSATEIPCIATLPSGWTYGGANIRRGDGRFWLDSYRAGRHALEVALSPREECDVTGAQRVPADETGTQRFERPERLPPLLESERFYLFEGGCARYRFSFSRNAPTALVFEVDQALTFEPRSTLVEAVEESRDLMLCSPQTPCPGS
ncbi:hypothetical protein BH18ACT4_BH18ACT4_06550 [soil metagenome]